MTLFETLRNVLPRSLFTHLGEPARAIEVPPRVAALIRAREEESERLIGWVQLVMAATFAALYVIANRPVATWSYSDAGHRRNACRPSRT